MFIYVNGDSYSASPNGKTYSDFLAEHYHCEVKNSAIPGSCNSRIFRTSLRDLMDIKQHHDEVIAVISVGFILRTEIWDQDIVNNRFHSDGEFVSMQTVTFKNWFNTGESTVEPRYQKYIQEWLRWYNVEAETVNLLKEILLLTTWCKYHKIRYVLFSGALQEPVDLNSEFIKSYYQAVKQDPNIIDVFENSFTEWCLGRGHTPIDDYTQEIHGKTYVIGHHGEPAHKDFANFLINNYLNKNNI